MRNKPTPEELNLLKILASQNTPMLQMEKQLKRGRIWIRNVLNENNIPYESRYVKNGLAHKGRSLEGNKKHWMDYVL